MFALIPFLMGPMGKIAGIVALIGALLLGGVFLLHEHDTRVLAQVQDAEHVAQIATMQADYARSLSALQAVADAAAARAVKINQIRSAIDATPHTSACVSSPAIGAAVDGLRKPSTASGEGAAADGPAVPAGVPGKAGAAVKG